MKSVVNKLYYTVSAFSIIVLGVLFAFLMQTGAQNLPIRQYFPTDKTIAVWDWSNPMTRDSKELSDLARYLYMHQVNTVYVDITVLADIQQANDEAEMARLTQSLKRYVTAMSKRNIRVFAAAGHVDWSKPSLRHIPLAIQQYTYEYNRDHPNARLAGLEFDIESYNQIGFEHASSTEKSLVLIELLNTVYEVVMQHHEYLQDTRDSAFEIGFAVPYWFDNQNGNIPPVTWHGNTGPTIYHLLDTLNTMPSSNIVVMAYRNAASGSDGTIFHSRTEVEYAQAKARNVQVIIGQEVTDIEPAKITFAGMTPTELSNEVSVITEAFKHIPAYGGIAINDLQGLQELDKNE